METKIKIVAEKSYYRPQDHKKILKVVFSTPLNNGNYGETCSIILGKVSIPGEVNFEMEGIHWDAFGGTISLIPVFSELEKRGIRLID